MQARLPRTSALRSTQIAPFFKFGVYDPLNILATPVVYRAPRNHRPVGPAASLMWARCEGRRRSMRAAR